MREKPVIRLVNLRWTASILFMLLVVRDDQAGVQYSNIGRDKCFSMNSGVFLT